MNGAAPARPGRLARVRAACWWLLAAGAVGIVAIGLLAPLLGAPEPGLPGRFGYWAETIVALWRPLGVGGGVLAIAAWWCGCRRAAMAFVVVAGLVLWPEFWSLLPRGMRGSGLDEGGGVALRIATVNLNDFGEDETAMAGALRQLDCDVLVLIEFTPRWERVLADHGVGDLVHRVIGEPGGVEGARTDGLRPAIVAGDLNAAPRSALRARLHELGWRSAGDDVHGQSPGTWPMDRAWAAPFRLAIDQILVDDAFVVDACELGPPNGSDHAPLVATIRLRQDR